MRRRRPWSWLVRPFTWRNYVVVDALLTLALAGGWVWFAYQYGFDNSPDSWYRGLLGKSIAEGHPYWVNVKQGYVYEYGPWHHDATHEPLLPAIYAVSFLLFGYRIAVANVVVSLSAGLLLFPLLRLGRAFTRSVWAGIALYLAVVCNEQLAFIFEVVAGLSLPTALLLLATFFWCLTRLVQTSERRWVPAAALAAAGFYYIRAETQLILWGLAACTLPLAFAMLPRAQAVRVARMWGIAFVLVLPWMVRKIVLFHNPFFTHMTPLMWTDRGYDYWSYHETIPFPTPATYFAKHTWRDLAQRVLVGGAHNVVENLQRATANAFWWYLGAAGVAAVAILLAADQRRRFVALTVWLVGIGYVAVLMLMTVLDTRYLIPTYFVIAFTLVAAPFLLVGRWMDGWRGMLLGIAVGGSLVGGVLQTQRDFWRSFRPKYLRYSYRMADQRMESDPLVQGLRQRFTPADVILGPFAEVQYLSFATGLTLLELPDNLKSLNDPAAFFEKYGIRYALADVGRILPKEMIEKVEVVGGRPLYTIGSAAARHQEDFFPEINVLEDGAIQSAIAGGVRERVVYIDGYHGAVPPDMSVFRDLGLNAFSFREDLAANQAKLFSSGVLLLQYAIGLPGLSDGELAVVKRYVANGGRVVLLCPAWVWLSYENKPLEELSCFKIAKLFGLFFTGEYVEPPYRLLEPALQVDGFAERLVGSTFSGVVGADARPLVAGKDGNLAGASAEAGRARLVVWGQNNLTGPVALTPQGHQFLSKLFDWLLTPAP